MDSTQKPIRHSKRIPEKENLKEELFVNKNQRCTLLRSKRHLSYIKDI